MSKLLTAMMVDDCLHDPVLGAKIILGYTVPPHMELRLWGMWTHKFFADSSGYGTAKSLCIAIVAALRACLMQDRVAGIISRTANQGQLIYGYLDKWAENCKIFRNQIRPLNANEIDSLHAQTAWEMTFKNQSKIRTVPPDFARDAARVASEDWNDGYFDEWTKYPSYEAFFKNVWTRVRRPINSKYDHNNPIFDRHFYLCGTARYQWHPCYSRISSFQDEIRNGSDKHELQSWNYTHIPKKYHHLIEMDGIRELEKSLPRDLAEQEIMGRWVKDSMGYYSFRDISEARSKECPTLLQRV